MAASENNQANNAEIESQLGELLQALSNTNNQTSRPSSQNDLLTAVSSQPRSASPNRPRGELHIDHDHLPVEISSPYAEKLNKLVYDVGRVWFSDESICDVEIHIMPRNPNDSSTSPRSIPCNSKTSIIEALQEIDPSKDTVLILVGSMIGKYSRALRDSYEGPACPLLAMLAIIKHFDLLPTFAISMESNPGIEFHSRATYSKEDGSIERGEFIDFHYSAPLPWISKDEAVERTAMHTGLFSVANYTRVDANGNQIFTIFSNLPSWMTEGIKDKWRDSIRESHEGSSPALFDHYELFGRALNKLIGDMKVIELTHGMLVTNRFEMHINSKDVNLRHTIASSMSAIRRLSYNQSALRTAQSILDALKEEIHSSSYNLPHKKRREPEKQKPGFDPTMIWNRNLTRSLNNIQDRMSALIQEQNRTETMVLSFVAQRDSAGLSRNTEQMAAMAKATERSGEEVHDMTKRMEVDAKQMRFLAEITAFFLPLTAIATFFSMDFLSIDNPGPGFKPSLSKVKYLWIYVVGLIATCTLVFGWWTYKYATISNHKGKSPDEVDSDEIEARMEAQSQVEKALRKTYATRKLAEAKAEWDAHSERKDKGNMDPDEVDRLDTLIFGKILCAQRARETGEDFDALFSTIESSYGQPGRVQVEEIVDS